MTRLFACYRLVADAGHSEAQCRLAIKYEVGGPGLPKIPEASIKYCRRAAWYDDVFAQFKLGCFNEKGLHAFLGNDER